MRVGTGWTDQPGSDQRPTGIHSPGPGWASPERRRDARMVRGNVGELHSCRTSGRCGEAYSLLGWEGGHLSLAHLGHQVPPLRGCCEGPGPGSFPLSKCPCSLLGPAPDANLSLPWRWSTSSLCKNQGINPPVGSGSPSPPRDLPALRKENGPHSCGSL